MNLQVNNLSFSYGKKELLNNISINLESSDILAILGPNGAGKTTFLKCILTLLNIKKGEVLIDGKSILSKKNSDIWSIIGYIPQAREVNSNFLVEDMIMLGRSNHISLFKLPNEEDIKIVDDIIEELGIGFLRGKYCNQISGGELQMVLIARALVNAPKILILDEPETNLDSFNQLKVLECIKKCSSKGLICIFNTHYPEHALQIANKSLIIKYDNTHEFGNTNDVVTEERLSTCFNVNTKIVNTIIDGKDFYSILKLDRLNKENDIMCSKDNCGCKSNEKKCNCEGSKGKCCSGVKPIVENIKEVK